MDTRISTYRQHADRFTSLVDRATDWSPASPCEGWTAADVVDHVVTTQRDFLIGHQAELGDAPAGSPDEIWKQHDEAVTRALKDEEWAFNTFDGYFGPTTIADTLSTFYGFDLIVHRWDIGQATDQPVQWSDEEMAQVEAAVAGFGEQLYMEGICKPALEPSPGADRQTRILATLGRSA